MKIVFIDEIEQPNKNRNFFGLGAIVVDSAYYKDLKKEFDQNFKNLGWSEKVEFKGRYIFSQKGDETVSIDKRIVFIMEIAKLSVAKLNSRYRFLFTYNILGRSENNYLTLLSKLIKKIQAPRDKKRDKNVVSVFYDSCDIDDKTIHESVLNNLKDGLVLFEKPFCVKSDNNTCGIIIVDIFSYLKSWFDLSSNDEDAQMTLFQNVGPRDNEKLKIIKEIISKIKNIKTIK